MWLKFYLKKSNDKIDYKFEDNYANETEYKTTGIDFALYSGKGKYIPNHSHLSTIPQQGQSRPL